tara:strand:- start:173 stop:331 length:159 start_codon:yes stop_codon:yes gene_type:complete
VKDNFKKRISIFPALKTREELMELPMRFHGSERTVATVVLMTAIATLDNLKD